MNIFEKIKQILFNKKQVKALPEQTQKDVKDYTSEVVITRNDGTTVTIRPRLDRLGNQMYEQVWSGYEKQMKCIPKFLVYSEELKELSGVGDTYMGTDMLIDIEPSELQNPEFAQYIGNKMLNKERMPKIVNEYGNYVGLVEKSLDDEGRVSLKKSIDTCVVQNLKISKEQRDKMIKEEMDKREQENITTMREHAKNVQVNYKSSHAEDLSQYQR